MVHRQGSWDSHRAWQHLPVHLGGVKALLIVPSIERLVETVQSAQAVRKLARVVIKNALDDHVLLLKIKNMGESFALSLGFPETLHTI